MLEGQLKLVLLVVVEPILDLRENPTPLLLLRWQDSEDGLESLRVEFALFEIKARVCLPSCSGS